MKNPDIDNTLIYNSKSSLKNQLVIIPEATFVMGGNKYPNEKPKHKVRLTSFFISQYPITNLQYERFDPSHSRCPASDENNQPVVNVSYNDALLFCEWAQVSLPTEAQWECACRAGTTKKYRTGRSINHTQANYDDYVKATTPVGFYLPNQNNVYDMHGNVWEWCKDWYKDDYYEELSLQETTLNPLGPDKGEYRVLRGGSWNGNAGRCRSAYRNWDYPDCRNGSCGFRVCLNNKEV